jgi:Fe2+ transport system protein FeoA
MGVLPGTAITLVRTAPLGDPLEVQVRGYSLTLRKSEAEHVVVELAGGR